MEWTIYDRQGRLDTGDASACRWDAFGEGCVAISGRPIQQTEWMVIHIPNTRLRNQDRSFQPADALADGMIVSVTAPEGSRATGVQPHLSSARRE